MAEIYDIETRCIHSGAKHSFGAVSVPIYQTATFTHPGVDKSSGYDYSRESNPTRAELENVVSALEGAYDTVATSSGMSAISLAFGLLPKGSHIICTKDLYGGSVRLFNKLTESCDFSFSYADTSDIKEIEKNILPETRAVYIETPSNPTMKISDLKLIGELTKRNNILFIVDNTFLTPYFQNPISFGADIVVHSGTKFLSGHNDTIAGFVCVADKELAGRLRFDYKSVGSCLSPFDSFLVLRGIKTLSVRLERQQENALQLAGFLKNHPLVKQVFYTGLEDSPGYDINKSQSRGFGCMISFKTDSEETALKVLSGVRLISYAESLGGVESLITYPLKQTHGDVPEEIRRELGITGDFLRLSVGIEGISDLKADLEQALR